MEVRMPYCWKKAKWLTFGLAEFLMVTFGMSEREAWGVIDDAARHHVGRES